MSDLISREYMKSLGATCIASRSKDGTLFPIVAIDELPPADLTREMPSNVLGALDCVERQAAIDALDKRFDSIPMEQTTEILLLRKDLRELPSALELFGNSEQLPSAQPERLTDDDFETIRIHLNAFKETLCNQRRWKEAEEYQHIIDRFMAFASTQPRKGKWIKERDGIYHCSCCGTDYLMYELAVKDTHFCPNCGADMRGAERREE